MKAMVIKEYGDSTIFQAIEMPVPVVQKKQVLVKIYASSLNPKDILQRQGGFYDPLPAVLHSDFSGTVEAIGGSVGDYKLGDKVYGCAAGIAGDQGALADYMAVDADQIASMPENLNFIQAAALPLVSLTAWEGLVDKAQVKSGNKVLVHGGAGGVGHAAVQIAKAKGAIVSTSVGNDHAASLVLTLGADNVFNYKSKKVDDYVNEFTGGAGFDIVFDSVGGSNFSNSVEAVKYNGQVACPQMFGEFNLEAAAFKGISLHFILMLIPLTQGIGRKHHGDILKEISNWVEEGKMKPIVHEEVFSFSHVGLAHKAYENGEVVGKLVLENDSWE